MTTALDCLKSAVHVRDNKARFCPGDLTKSAWLLQEALAPQPSKSGEPSPGRRQGSADGGLKKRQLEDSAGPGDSQGVNPDATTTTTGSVGHRRKKQAVLPADLVPKCCPRCESMSTKFCYYNNYNTTQPRYYCRVRCTARASCAHQPAPSVAYPDIYIGNWIQLAQLRRSVPRLLGEVCLPSRKSEKRACRTVSATGRWAERCATCHPGKGGASRAAQLRVTAPKTAPLPAASRARQRLSTRPLLPLLRPTRRLLPRRSPSPCVATPSATCCLVISGSGGVSRPPVAATPPRCVRTACCFKL